MPITPKLTDKQKSSARNMCRLFFRETSGATDDELENLARVMQYEPEPADGALGETWGVGDESSHHAAEIYADGLRYRLEKSEKETSSR